MQKKLNVVFTIDENYIQHFCVACTSLLDNNKNIGRIFLVQDIEEENKKLLSAINYLEQYYYVKIEKLSLDSKILENFKITHHVSKATYFRLLLSEILPKDIDSVMFLDSDIVVNDSLDGILELDFLREDNLYVSHQDGLNETTYSSNYEYYIFAVNHKYGEDELLRLRGIGFEGNKYFNAGIMYINLKKWREDDISSILIENAIKYNDHLLWWDQDVLNITFDKEWGELEHKYNNFDLNDRLECDNSVIVHYIGFVKPWHFMCQHPCKHLYWKYLKNTPFKDYKYPDLNIKNCVLKYTPLKLQIMIGKVLPKFLKEKIKCNAS